MKHFFFHKGWLTPKLGVTFFAVPVDNDLHRRFLGSRTRPQWLMEGLETGGDSELLYERLLLTLFVSLKTLAMLGGVPRRDDLGLCPDLGFQSIFIVPALWLAVPAFSGSREGHDAPYHANHNPTATTSRLFRRERQGEPIWEYVIYSFWWCSSYLGAFDAVGNVCVWFCPRCWLTVHPVIRRGYGPAIHPTSWAKQAKVTYCLISNPVITNMMKSPTGKYPFMGFDMWSGGSLESAVKVGAAGGRGKSDTFLEMVLISTFERIYANMRG